MERKQRSPTPRKKPAEKMAAVAADEQRGILVVPGLPTRVWYSCGLTLSLRQYESARVDAGMSTDVEPGEEIAVAYERCRDNAEGEVRRQAVDIRSLADPDEPSRGSKSKRRGS
jgi:hypothetical protein